MKERVVILVGGIVGMSTAFAADGEWVGAPCDLPTNH